MKYWQHLKKPIQTLYQNIHLSEALSLGLPIILILVYLVLLFIFKDLLPSGEEVIANFSKLFAKYGYEIVFFGAFLEAALVVDLFVPGASVVLAGAYFASTDLISYPIFLAVAATGFFLGFLLDYLIGYYGWSDILRKLGLGTKLDSVDKKVQKYGGKSFFLGYFHPDMATLFAVSAGIMRMNFKEFIIYNFLAGSVWLIIWTGAVYLLGLEVQQLFENPTVFLILLVPVLFVVYRIVK